MAAYIADDAATDMAIGESLLVAPQPILTAVIKQAEISSTEKVAMVKKTSPISRLSADQQLDKTHVSHDLRTADAKTDDDSVKLQQKSKRAAFYWAEDEEVLTTSESSTDITPLGSVNDLESLPSQIFGTGPKKKSSTDVTKEKPDAKTSPSIISNSDHRKFIANTLVKLTSNAFGLDDDSSDIVPTPSDSDVASPDITSRVILPLNLTDQSPPDGSLPDHSAAKAVRSKQTAPHLVESKTFPALISSEGATSPQPAIWPALTPLSQTLGRRKERRKEVLTNGSLRRPTQTSKQDNILMHSQLLTKPGAEPVSNVETFKRQTNVQRPNSLDIVADVHRMSNDGMNTPRSCGLVNPGFVFESTPSAVVEEGKPANSPSLLDVLHKKYWANSSPGSTLTRKHTGGNELSPTSPTKPSVFRARHASYCRIVDQNADEVCPDINDALSQKTLPNRLAKSSSSGQVIRMFGDVSQMFQTMPVRGSREGRHRATSETEIPKRPEDIAVKTQQSGSTDKLLNATPLAAPSSGSTKLARKFSLSPKVLRRKIIAKLQQENEKGASSGSEADDPISAAMSRFRQHKELKKIPEQEIELLSAIAWLGQAGFPQYVQLFEEAQLPVDVEAVQRDHSFLEEQRLQCLLRRINVLNKSAHMKLDINSKKMTYASGGDEEDEDSCVLSDKWQYERSSKRWAHVDAAPTSNAARMRSCSSRDSVMTDETAGEDTGDNSSPLLQSKNSGYGDNNNTLKVDVMERSLSDSSSSTTSPKSQQASEVKPQSKRVGSFFKGRGSLNRRAGQKSLKKEKTANVVPLISEPVLVNSEDMSERMERLGCVMIRPNKTCDSSSDSNSTFTKLTQRQCDGCSVDTTLTEYRLPPDYKHGTFPKELLESELPSCRNSLSNSKNSNSGSACDMQVSSNRRSVYDNLSDEEQPMPTPTTQARRELDAVLRDLLFNITNLDLDDTTSSDLIKSGIDSAIVSPMSEELSSLPSDTPADSPEQKRRSSEGAVASSSSDELSTSLDNMVEGGEVQQMQDTIWRERRDSGVGSSLTREPTERKKKARLRWHSFVASHRPSFNSQNEHLSSLTAGQLLYVRKLALLIVTSLIEQHSPSHKSGFSLHLVNRFMKKGSKTPDYSTKKVFGVPLSLILQRTGQPLPQCILHAMRHLRKSAADSVGIFRKSGVRSRIQKLRDDLEKDPDNVAQFESMQSYDVADMLKQYLRELPECLLTNKLSDAFLAIYQHVPQEQRLEALQACVIMLPDENREVLESLLYFLSDMAAHHEDNQMTASNLAMCFAPSLFNIHNRSSQTKSPKSAQKNNIGVPDQREMQEQRSATDCLTAMITDCKHVFRIPQDVLSKCTSFPLYMEAGEPAPLSLLGAAPDYQTHIDSCMQGLLKESKDRNWTSVAAMPSVTGGEDSVDVSYKKVPDNNPLRLWKCSIEIQSTPEEVLNRVLNERQKWDEDLLKWKTVEKLDDQLDIFQYISTSMAPQPSREYVTLRAWKKNLLKGACALVMHSIDHEVSSLGGGIRGIVLASHYLMEPTTGGHCKLTHISRIDSKGRQAKWYNNSYGIVTANNLLRIKESLAKPQTVNVHETKV